LASTVANRLRGTMIWFNEEKDLGAVRTDDGMRLEVSGSAFPPGGKPVGRCAGRVVEIDLAGGTVAAITLVEDQPQRRARMRHRR
jgi:hypothetical protein